MRRPDSRGLSLRHFVGAAAVALLAALVFAPALGSFFVADDFFLLDAVVSGGPFGAWPRDTSFFRPLASASLWLDHRAWGLVPLPFHATNLVLHFLATLAAASAARRLVARFGAREEEASRAGLLTGLFFLLLPAHAEPVNWISARPDLLAGLFALAALALALRHEETGKPSAALLSAALFAASLLSKESGATWPLVAFLLLVPPPQGGLRTRGARLLAPSLLVLVLLAYLPLRAALLGGLVRGYGEGVHLDLSPLLLGDNLLRFLGRSLVPHVGLAESLGSALGSALAAATLPRVETWMDRGAGLFVLAAAFALALRGRGAVQRLALPALGAFLVASLPAAYLGIGASGPQGERFLYLPSFFAALAVASAVSSARFPARRNIAALLLVAAWGGALVAANLSWRAAGELSRTIVFSLRGAPAAEETLLLALPDNVRGAYVVRTFLPRALALFGQEKAWGRTAVLASTDLARPDARVDAIRTGECWETTPGRGARIRALIPPPPGSGLELSPGPGGGYRACEVPVRASRRWAVVSGGAVVVLASPGEGR